MTAHQLLRRTVDHVASYASDGHKNVHLEINGGVVLLLALTGLVWFLVLLATSYTLGHVLPTLCMIEASETNAYVPVNNIAGEDQPPAYTEGDDGALPAPADDEVQIICNKPFTTSIRATLRHLRARAGRRSFLRGFGLFLVLGLLRNILTTFLSFGRPLHPVIMPIAIVVADTLLANIHMTWIHVVISEPSPLRWWHRLPTPAFQAWKRIAPAVAIWSVTTQITYMLPMLVVGARADRFTDPGYQPGRKDVLLTFGQINGAMLLTLVLFVLIEIPAMVVMTRVAASMLPEEDEAIVPFDRSYGGKVRPAIVGGQGKVGIVEAWKTFTWASRRRLVLLCAKATGIAVAIWMSLFIVLTIEVFAVVGVNKFAEILKIFHSKTHA